MTTRTTAHWVATPAIRSSIRVPPDVRGAAYIVAVIRALLLDARLPASDDYRVLVATLAPEVQAIKAEAEVLVADPMRLNQASDSRPRWEGGLVPTALTRLGPQVVGVAVDLFRMWRSPTEERGFGVFDAEVKEFARRWLFGSETGRQVLCALATVDAAGVDPLAIDWRRAERSETWKVAYGEHTTRLSRRRHKEMMGRLKNQGWHPLHDGALMGIADDWVESRHVYASESDWLRAKGLEPGPAYNALSDASKRFKPFDDALGIRRKPGRPRRVGTTV